MARSVDGPDEVNVRRRIQREMDSRGWNAAELTRQLNEGRDIAQISVYRMVAKDNPRTIRVDDLGALAKVFGTTIEGLLTPVELIDYYFLPRIGSRDHAP